MSKLVELATAYATQTTTERNGKGEWVVYNTAKEIIFRFPKGWTEKEVMFVIHFGRKFELIAFNKGVNFQKDLNPKKMKALQDMVSNFEGDREQMISRNKMLAGELEKLNEQLDKLTIKN